MRYWVKCRTEEKARERRKQLIDDLTEIRKYRKLKEEKLARIPLTIRLGRGCGLDKVGVGGI
jgi:hypothetical protein